MSTYFPLSSMYSNKSIDGKSIKPLNSFESSDWMFITSGSTFNLFFIEFVVVSILVPSLSNLLINPNLGILYLLAYIQTVSLYVSTPCIASKTAIAPSQTLKLLSTSAVKSTCPGVSIRLI